MSIEIRNLTKRFGPTLVCDDLSLTVRPGELVALLGPSGSGKTSLLRMIAGLEQPDAGSVLLHGADATHADVRRRKVGFVFQHYALFPNMSVFENVAFGLRVMPRRERPGEATIRAKVAELLELVQLDGVGQRFAHQLSGGQRQRVALARALAIEPEVLLLDEPFGALDAQVRKELRRWLRRLHDEVHVTSIFVTHDQDEAMEVADRIVIMNAGRIEQDGSPEQVYAAPASPFVLHFLGEVNRLDAPGADESIEDVEASGRSLGAAGASYVRPDELRIVAAADHDTVAATVVQVLALGARTRIECRRRDDGSPIEVELPRQAYAALQQTMTLRPGTTVELKPGRVIRFGAPAPTTEALDALAA